MADTFTLGSIPPLSAWQGETLTFKVTSSLGAGVKFSKRAMPSPKGKTSIDEKTGVFTYEPAAEDKDEFAVWIRARKGSKNDKPQKIHITPYPQRPPEFKVIEHVSKNPPDPASKFYITFSLEDAGRAHFNRTGLNADPQIMTKKVTVAGVRLVIEENSDEGSLYNKLKDRKDLRQLTLCADEVVIRCELKLPGTDVHIYARQLSFEDDGKKIARIVTTPLPIELRPAPSRPALRGQKGGDVHLFVKSLVTPGTAHRIITQGGKGQPGAEGQKGADGTSVPVWDGKVTVEKIEFDFSRELRSGFERYKKEEDREKLEKGKPIWVCVMQRITSTEYGPPSYYPAKMEPTNGHEPAYRPYFPGAGGDGGSVFTRLAEQLESRVNLRPGDTGDPAHDLAEAKAGGPSPYLTYLFYYTSDVLGPHKFSFELIQYGTTKPYEKVEAPRTPQRGGPSINRSGEIAPLKSKTGESYWLHPAAVRAVIAYCDDAYLAGHTEEARKLLSLYLEAVKVAAAADKDEPGWALLGNELATLSQRVEGPYDYFGNPAGWVPMLSFQTNFTLFETEVKSAVEAMFLAYWIEHTQARVKAAVDILKAAKNRLHDETQRALKDLSAAETRAIELSVSMATIAGDLALTWVRVTAMKERLTDEARKDLQAEHRLRAAAKVLGGVMQLIPVGQPVLGSVGKTFTVLGDIDTDNPSASVGKVLGAFAPVATEIVLPKAQAKVEEKFLNPLKKRAKEMFSGLFQEEQLALTEKEAKEKEKKAEFDKEVEKEELEKKVKQYLEKKEEAKNSILAGFSQFAVSEDDLKKRLEKVLADAPAYKELVEEIRKLNERKRQFYEKFVATMQAIDAATTIIINNQLAVVNLQVQLDAKLEQLNLEALQSVQDMGRKARERLLLYQYYLLKSYHYLMLKDLPEIDFGAQKLFDEFATLLSQSEEKLVEALKKEEKNEKEIAKLLSESGNGILSDDQYKRLSAIFTNQLRAIAKQIITTYQVSGGKSEKSVLVKLTPAQIETLNSDAKRVEVDLRWVLNLQHEDIRITNIVTDNELVALAEPFPKDNVTLYLDYVHDGVSKVRHAGRLYLFRSGQYRVEAADIPPRTDIRWGTTLEYIPAAKKKLTVEPTKPDPEVTSLVKKLISEESSKNSMMGFRPGAWTRISVQRSGTETAKIKHLTLRIFYVSRSVDTDAFSTVAVKVTDNALPYIRCSAVDMNGCGDGAGSFLRTFKKEQGSVTLTAPAYYGSRALRGWRQGAAVERVDPIIDKDVIGAIVHSTFTRGIEKTLIDKDFIKTIPHSGFAPDFDKEIVESITLSLSTPDVIVEPVYAPLMGTPVDQQGEEWPRCPVGWSFEDWIFVNGTKSVLTVNSIGYSYGFATVESKVAAQVNEPQGGTKIKLSFERLKLLPGEETKLSVCLNPEIGGAGGGALFYFESASRTYYVRFGIEGSPTGFHGPSDFDMDTDNRVLTFARP
jgi:hypothetical protein